MVRSDQAITRHMSWRFRRAAPIQEPIHLCLVPGGKFDEEQNQSSSEAVACRIDRRRRSRRDGRGGRRARGLGRRQQRRQGRPCRTSARRGRARVGIARGAGCGDGPAPGVQHQHQCLLRRRPSIRWERSVRRQRARRGLRDDRPCPVEHEHRTVLERRGRQLRALHSGTGRELYGRHVGDHGCQSGHRLSRRHSDVQPG